MAEFDRLHIPVSDQIKFKRVLDGLIRANEGKVKATLKEIGLSESAYYAMLNHKILTKRSTQVIMDGYRLISSRKVIFKAVA